MANLNTLDLNNKPSGQIELNDQILENTDWVSIFKAAAEKNATGEEVAAQYCVIRKWETWIT